MSKNTHCPNCWIGLNADERNLRYCQNCSHSWTEKEEEEENDSLQDAIEESKFNNAVYIATIQ